MHEASVYLSGTLPPCPARFNAAAYCLSGPAAPEAEAFCAVEPDTDKVTALTFAELRAQVLRAAGAYQAAGVRPGDRVVLLLGDVPAFPVAYFGAIAAGAVATPLSSQLAEAEVGRIIAAVEPAAIVGGRNGTLTTDALANGPTGTFVACAARDPALLVFTSGSSGRPKGVLHAHRAFWARRSMHAGWHDIRAGDRVMHAGAFNWTFTLGVGLADTWSVGATAILNAGRRDPAVWPDLARHHRPTVFAGAPAVFRRILKYGQGLDTGFASLRHAVTAGEALSASIAEAWQSETGRPLLESLGMSEVSTYISTSPTHPVEPGIAGWPQPGRQVAVLDDAGEPVAHNVPGMLAVRRSDPGLFLRYWKDLALTDAAMSGQWFLTGDRVAMREDGAIRYIGRADDQINAQGYRVDPGEVEEALTTCESISECAVRALEVEDGLSLIAAWLVAEDGATIDATQVAAHLEDRLADYKRPRALFCVEALPRSANGKIMRRLLTPDGATRL